MKRFALLLLLSTAAFADPIPRPDPCRIEAVKKKGETCVVCSAPKSEPKACETQHADDGFQRRCTRWSGTEEIWCKGAARTKD